MTFGALVLTVILMTLGVLYFSDQIAQTEHHAREVRNGGMEYVFGRIFSGFGQGILFCFIFRFEIGVQSIRILRFLLGSSSPLISWIAKGRALLIFPSQAQVNKQPLMPWIPGVRCRLS